MAEQQKKTSEEQKKPAKAGDVTNYANQMGSSKTDPSAVAWQNKNDAQLAAATTSEALAAILKDDASCEALLAKIQPAYSTDPLTLTVIGAVSQFVMDPANGHSVNCGKQCKTPGAGVCRRNMWCLALLAAFRKTKDEYIQTFILDQLRWCACKRHADDVLKLKASAMSYNVKKYIDWAHNEIVGGMMNVK